jgi:hypothetical protein
MDVVLAAESSMFLVSAVPRLASFGGMSPRTRGGLGNAAARSHSNTRHRAAKSAASHRIFVSTAFAPAQMMVATPISPCPRMSSMRRLGVSMVRLELDGAVGEPAEIRS